MKAYHQMFEAGVSMTLVARRIHEAYSKSTPSDRDVLRAHVRERTDVLLNGQDWLNINIAQLATHRMLQQAFSAWREEARTKGAPLLHDDELPIEGQMLVLNYLPIAPLDYGNKEFIEALSRCALYYLS